MWLNETLKIKYPLIQGGMANIATGALRQLYLMQVV